MPVGRHARGGRACADARPARRLRAVGNASCPSGRELPSMARRRSTRCSSGTSKNSPSTRWLSTSGRCSRPCATASSTRARCSRRQKRLRPSARRRSGESGEAWPPGKSRPWPATRPAAERAARRTHQLLEELGETGFRSLAAGQLALISVRAGAARGGGALDTGGGGAHLQRRRDLEHAVAASAREASCPQRPACRRRAARARGRRPRRGDGHAQLARECPRRPGRGRLVLAGRPEAGCARLEQALALYESKGNLVSAASARSTLDDLRPPGLRVIEQTTQ